MFLVANSYDKGSDQFKEVFDIAVRLYPTDPIAQLNTAALEIETGAYDPAISRLQGINLPEAWNNLGVAYAMKKDYTTLCNISIKLPKPACRMPPRTGMSWPLGWPSNNGDTYLRI